MEGNLNNEESKHVLNIVIKLQLFYFITTLLTYFMRMKVLKDVVYLLIATVILIALSVGVTYAYWDRITKIGVKLTDRISVFILIQVPSSVLYLFTMIVFLGARVIYD